jgi:phage-related protein
MADIESLELQITGDASKAKAGLDALIDTLDALKNKVKGGVGLTSVANQVRKMADAAGKMNGSEGAKLESLAKGLQALSGLGNLKLSSSIANQISAMGTAVRSLDGADFSKVKDLAAGLAPLETLGKTNLGSTLTQIKRLPEVMTELGKVDMGAFKTKIQELTASLKPLADEMQKVANGFSAFPAKIQQLLNSSSKVPSSNASTGKSFANLAAKVTATIYTFKKAAGVIASWINESNEYVENMNLFTVSMGEYAGSAMEYANTVSDAMGIDTSDWIRNQGVFMTLSTGFGVATDRAATMSQQLTQLGYDISSFYNTSVEDAMQRLQSGLAGELEPLRRLGYDLSQAKLEATALRLGIDKAVSSMTQAEKAELRYYAIMTQVTQVQGDMARTLQDPANQLRIFRAQLQMVARSLGNIFIPALNAILPYAIAAVKVIRLLADAIAGLFGYEFPEVGESSIGGLGDSASDASNSIDEATDSAKKLRKTLLGIDELNVMSDTSASGDSDIGGGGSFDFNLPTYDFIGEATNSRVNQIVEEMKEWLGITGEIKSWSDLFHTKLGAILITVGLIGLAFASWKIASAIPNLTAFFKNIGKLESLAGTAKMASSIFLTLVGGVTLAVSAFDAFSNGIDWGNLLGMLGGMGLIVGGLAISFDATGAAIGLLVGGITLLVTGIMDALDGSKSLETALAIITGILAIGGGIAILIVGWVPLAIAAVVAAVAMIVMYWDEIVVWFKDTCTVVGQFFVDLWNGIVSVWNTVATWFDANVIQPVVSFFSGLWTSVSGFFVNLWTDIVTIFTSVAAWFDINVIQPVVNFFVGLWVGISTAASECWNAIVAFFSPAVQWFSDLFSSVWQTLSDIFYNIGVIASGCWEIIKAVWGIVCNWFDTNVIQPVSNFFTQLWATISTAAINAWNGIKSVFATICGWIDQYIIRPVSTFFVNLWNGMRTAAINAWNGIKSAYASVTTWISTNIIQPVGNFFSNLWTGFINGAKNAWAGVKSVFSSVASFFQTTFQNAWAGIVKVFSTAGQIFVNIKNAILTAFKSIVNGIITGLNNVIAIPFKGINTALNAIKSINILGLTPFSGLKAISVPVIPYLAQGGVVDAGQLFVANEVGPELVGNVGRKTAVMNNDQIVDSVSQGVYRAVLQAMGQSGGNQVVEAKVNDKVLFEVVVSRNRQETMRTGHSPLLGGV